MQALLLIAHGSRREASNQEVRELEKAVRKHAAVSIHQSDYLGKHKSIPELLLALALDKSDPGTQHEPAKATG